MSSDAEDVNRPLGPEFFRVEKGASKRNRKVPATTGCSYTDTLAIACVQSMHQNECYQRVADESRAQAIPQTFSLFGRYWVCVPQTTISETNVVFSAILKWEICARIVDTIIPIILTMSFRFKQTSLMDVASELSTFFMGVYCSDRGLHCANGARGFALKSTFYVYLIRLLWHCGIINPRIRFNALLTQMPVRYNTAFLGGVTWIIYNAAIRRLIDETGLPSSQVTDTVLDRFVSFISPLLACFVLGLSYGHCYLHHVKFQHPT
ncbi:predicted protein [Lichtheimia corymbifera JMRC:FSU:9682]|uniref:Uncharacterized protein n=1 Tax=Lichtheimia corymbifera JMRC:FSU:9682 TaxID=1263082 RepID=A0A068S129_9FUNG|nr:predicted protein [Lichtheimia corymbifera JMRC:FSU:9682]